MQYLKFIFSILMTLWMLYDAYQWWKRDWNDFEPKIVFKGFVLALIVLFYDQCFQSPPKIDRLTVFVKDSIGKIPNGLVNKAKVVVFYNHKSEKKTIGEDGVVAFDQIVPPEGDSLLFQLLETEDYELETPKLKYNGEPISLKTRSMCRFCKIAGIVRQQKALFPNAIVRTGAYVDTTDANGYFEINIPSDKEQLEYPVMVIVKGKIMWNNFITPNPKQPAEILIEK